MSIRISTATQFELSVNNLQQRQFDLLTTQDRLTSGKRISRASDDPTAAAIAERAMATQMRIEVNQRALQASRNVVQQSESALGSAGDILQRFRELTVQMGNGTFGTSDRNAMVEEMKGLREQLFRLANRSDSAGNYLFGGQGGQGEPFVDGLDASGNPTVTYQGSRGSRYSANVERMPLAVDGYEAWMVSRQGSGTVEKSLFQVVDTIIRADEIAASGGAKVSETVNAGLDDLDAGMANLSAIRSSLGGLLNQADGVDQRLSQSKVEAQAERSSAEDLDMVQAVSEFQTRQTSYDAALRAYSMVQRLSLFDYLR